MFNFNLSKAVTAVQSRKKVVGDATLRFAGASSTQTTNKVQIRPALENKLKMHPSSSAIVTPSGKNFVEIWGGLTTTEGKLLSEITTDNVYNFLILKEADCIALENFYNVSLGSKITDNQFTTTSLWGAGNKSEMLRKQDANGEYISGEFFTENHTDYSVEEVHFITVPAGAFTNNEGQSIDSEITFAFFSIDIDNAKEGEDYILTPKAERVMTEGKTPGRKSTKDQNGKKSNNTAQSNVAQPAAEEEDWTAALGK